MGVWTSGVDSSWRSGTGVVFFFFFGFGLVFFSWPPIIGTRHIPKGPSRPSAASSHPHQGNELLLLPALAVVVINVVSTTMLLVITASEVITALVSTPVVDRAAVAGEVVWTVAAVVSAVTDVSAVLALLLVAMLLLLALLDCSVVSSDVVAASEVETTATPGQL